MDEEDYNDDYEEKIYDSGNEDVYDTTLISSTDVTRFYRILQKL